MFVAFAIISLSVFLGFFYDLIFKKPQNQEERKGNSIAKLSVAGGFFLGLLLCFGYACWAGLI